MEGHTNPGCTTPTEAGVAAPPPSASSACLPLPCDPEQAPKFKPAAELMPAAKALAEQAQGRFTAAALLEGKSAGSSRAPAVADWVGPLELFASPTAGRGLRATRAVAAGELLLVERALAVAQVGG